MYLRELDRQKLGWACDVVDTDVSCVTSQLHSPALPWTSANFKILIAFLSLLEILTVTPFLPMRKNNGIHFSTCRLESGSQTAKYTQYSKTNTAMTWISVNTTFYKVSINFKMNVKSEIRENEIFMIVEAIFMLILNIS